MVKTGIWKHSQLTSRRSILGRPRTLSLALLRSADGFIPPPELMEEIVHDLRLSSGIYRTTCANRFLPVDDEINGVLERCAPAGQPLIVRDWACSDALAASEWAESLRRRVAIADFEASDLLLFLVESHHPLAGSCILEPNGAPLQYVRVPFVVSLCERESAFYPLNRIVVRLGLAISREPARLCPGLQWGEFPDARVIAAGGWSFRQIPLVHPRALQLQRENPWFRLALHSVFDVAVMPAHVIRTMNVLNRAYFPENRIAEAARAVLHSLLPGGLWVLGNSGEPRAPRFDISILRREAGGFRAVHRIGGGSEVESVALAVQPLPA